MEQISDGHSQHDDEIGCPADGGPARLLAGCLGELA